MSRPRVEGRFFFPDSSSMGPCALDDPEVQTVWVLVETAGGPVNFHFNEDRLGYVDPELGRARFDLAVKAAHLFVAAPDLLAAAEALLRADGQRVKVKVEVEAALDRLEAAVVKAHKGEG